MKKWITIIDNLLKTNYGEVLVNSTELCLIMNQEGSDKGNGHHNFSKIYHELFKDIREHPINIFELGMGTNNPYINSNMGPNGKPGASLRGWSKYFTLAKIYGADIDGIIVNGRYDTDRIKTVWVDQRSPSTINDDGLHEVRANITFLENSHHKLSEGGIYIIEDILPHEIKIFEEKLSSFCQSNKFEYRLLDIPECRNKVDNKLIILSRV
jgi:hypothetical protein